MGFFVLLPLLSILDFCGIFICPNWRTNKKEANNGKYGKV